MRSASRLASNALHRYFPGDVLLEPQRLSYNALHTLAGSTAGQGDDAEKSKSSGIWDLLKPGKDDLKGVKGALKFLKFSPSEIENYVNAIGTMVSIAGGIVTVVGIFNSAKEILTKLKVLESEEFNIQKALEQIGMRMEQVYSYLEASEAKGLFVEARGWREDIAKARGAIADAKTSRSPVHLEALVDRAAELDGSLSSMLDPGSGDIAFRRSVYGYKVYSSHWVDAASWPWLTLATGAEINYAPESSDLSTRIWDAGHYIDVLVRALSDRLLLVSTAEPLFRSTGFNRTQLTDLANALTRFIEKWKASMIVTQPAVGINAGGHVRNPFWSQSAPTGILLGAIDPVTGTAAWTEDWQGFTRKFTTTTSPLSTSIHPDFAEAVDPAQALRDAADAQAEMLDFVISVSGIPNLAQLRMHLLKAASAVIGSEVVDLPDASFARLSDPWVAAKPETVDLGRLKKYSPHPSKTYQAERNYQEIEKTFRFRMAKRTELSFIQLGYRLTVGDKSIPLVDFSKAPYLSEGVTAFPKGTIEFDYQDDAHVYDVHQERGLSVAEEDEFETTGSVAETPRLFLNRRVGRISLAGSVTFVSDPNDEKYTGEAIVKIRNVDPEQFPNATILLVQVMETHVGQDGATPVEELADNMTIHIVPSYLTLGADYFKDYQKALAASLRVIEGLQDKYGLDDMRLPTGPDPDPKWGVQRVVLDTIATLDVLDKFEARHPDVMQTEIARLLPPISRRLSVG